jgi:hypothetical protein
MNMSDMQGMIGSSIPPQHQEMQQQQQQSSAGAQPGFKF